MPALGPLAVSGARPRRQLGRHSWSWLQIGAEGGSDGDAKRLLSTSPGPFEPLATILHPLSLRALRSSRPASACTRERDRCVKPH
ncbi:MAG: hypothetical protein ACPIOQ_31210 [Promethearchaeia archaeon]